MFKDKKFKVKYTTDKRGRPVNHSSTEDLKRYYDLTSESESDTSDGGDNEAPEKLVKGPKDENNEIGTKHKSNKLVPDKIKGKLKDLNVDYARGEGKLCSESSSDDDDTDEENEEDEQLDHRWGELDADAEQTEKATSRLAACNMDWDRIRAVDLMVLFNSFLPSGGVVKSVAIYPSEFGKTRMKEEEVKGPVELVESKVEESEDENEEGSNFHMEKLRQYQLNRLKYYYAVITFDNSDTANKIYTECDCMEYESSAIKLDLRFIPDDMEFEDEPKEICDRLPELNRYQPRFFTNTALQQAKVNLTWDETNPDRIEVVEKISSGKIDDISEVDLQNYLASSSESDAESEDENEKSRTDEEDTNPVDKYKALLKEIEEKETAEKDKVEMEISWGIDLKEKTEKLAKEKLAKTEEKTPFQQYLDKRKQKKKEKRNKRKENAEKNSDDSDSDMPSDIDMNDPYFADEFNKTEFKKPKSKKRQASVSEEEDEQRKAELELLLMNDDDHNKKHFSLKKIQDNENDSKNKKKRRKKGADEEKGNSDDFKVNIEDPRFSAIFTSHHYNIDPTDPHYKKTKGMETLMNEKIKRREGNTEQQIRAKKPQNDGTSKNAELRALVKSIKRKAENSLQSKK
ncbi:unnamed protein product [Acanthoscelides obtectus]|uniref:NUC153 domain-containing protein n=1 Tax=Acanthoscelides obtectus TaxID=200917 RepID=A0A9P0LJB0_ACAOB|nr:unnamed protein product [Acanthoscelides obtectus]CAK1671863.1 ESF1 homolog [Acanthoscelides obtectus]